jgi:nicotinate-nucleotide pyrophosphorylase (carboxylating)
MNATLPDILVEPLIRAALAEDFGRAGDVTAGLLRDGERFSGVLRARKAGVLSGMQAARLAFRLVDPTIAFAPGLSDGARLAAGDEIARLEGPAGPTLAAERTALNFLTLMSGVATLTRAYVDAVAGTGAQIAATRKTLPGLRVIQKAAVLHGGGSPHRYGLDDAILIKDNHIAACGGVGEALSRARLAAGHMRVIEVEVDTLAQLDEALAHQPHAILLDNFSLEMLRAAVARAGGAAILEASGGVTLDTVRAIAETGVGVISVGALTHSAPALDIGLDA